MLGCRADEQYVALLDGSSGFWSLDSLGSLDLPVDLESDPGGLQPQNEGRRFLWLCCSLVDPGILTQAGLS